MDKSKDIKDLMKNMKKDPELLNTLDVDELLKAIHNEKTDYLENKTIKSMNQEVFDAIQSLNISEERIHDLYHKLIDYRLVNDIYEVHKGQLVKTLSLNVNQEENYIPKLHMKGKVIDIKFLDNGTHIVCLNTPFRFSQYKFDHFLTFQKLSDEEKLILSAYEMIQST
jgi:hypothetical protein